MPNAPNAPNAPTERDNLLGVNAALRRDYDGEKSRGDKRMDDCKRAEAELAKLKAHAEEMAHYTDCYKDKWPDSGAGYTLAAYRAAYPKE